LVVTTGFLDRNTPVTLKAGLDIPTPDPGAELPWTGRYDRVLGQSVPLLVAVGVLVAAAAVAGLLVTRSTREREPAFPLMYAPPEGIGPAQAKYVMRE